MVSFPQSPEQFSALPYGGVGRRLLALLYDILIVAGLWMVYGFLALMLTSALGGLNCQPQQLDYSPCVGGLWFQLGLLLVTFGYFCWSWRVAGQTVGMRAWRLMLANGDGTRLSLLQCVVRAAVALISLAAAGCGFWWGLTRADRASWHDLAAASELRILPAKTSAGASERQ